MVPKYIRQYYSGTVEPAAVVTLSNGEKFERTEPKGSLVVSVWDRKYATNVPVELYDHEEETPLAQRGTVLNVQRNADVLHPISWQIHRLDGYEMETDSMVLDLRGGGKLPSTDKNEELKAPGEFLVMDAEGRLLVRDEISDLESYQMSLFDDKDFGPGINSARLPNMGDGMEGMGEPEMLDGAGDAAAGDFGLLDE